SFLLPHDAASLLSPPSRADPAAAAAAAACTRGEQELRTAGRGIRSTCLVFSYLMTPPPSSRPPSHAAPAAASAGTRGEQELRTAERGIRSPWTRRAGWPRQQRFPVNAFSPAPIPVKVLQFRLQRVRAAKSAMRSRVLLLVLWSLAMVVVALLWKGGQADAYYYYVPTLAVRCHPRQPPAPRSGSKTKNAIISDQ
ncbi:unnamed protein product, partial [Urochloa humidicola]